MRSEAFREQRVPEIAKELALRFSKTLAPLFPTTSGAQNWNTFPTWGETEEEWQSRRGHSEKLFEAALLTKADASLNIEDYEIVLYPPGTPFNTETMVAGNREGELQGNSAEGRAIRLCLEAALFLHDRADIYDDSPISHAIVGNNFVRRRPGERRRVPLVKAIVVVPGDG